MWSLNFWGNFKFKSGGKFNVCSLATAMKQTTEKLVAASVVACLLVEIPIAMKQIALYDSVFFF